MYGFLKLNFKIEQSCNQLLKSFRVYKENTRQITNEWSRLSSIEQKEHFEIKECLFCILRLFIIYYTLLFYQVEP